MMGYRLSFDRLRITNSNFLATNMITSAKYMVNLNVPSYGNMLVHGVLLADRDLRTWFTRSLNNNCGNIFAPNL